MHSFFPDAPAFNAKQGADFNQARVAKKDEFYTQLSDIEKELVHYKEHFAGKVVYCNCDNPEWSAFWQYFRSRFDELQLAKLVSSHFALKDAYRLEYDGVIESKTPLLNGGFRTRECIDYLDQVDIVITNPPFSLFREYVMQLLTRNKKFLIVGNFNALQCKRICPYILRGDVWLGHNTGLEFRMHASYPVVSPSTRTDEKGNNFVTVSSTCWFTNLGERPYVEPLELTATYNPTDYPKYDNYDAIEVSKVKDIPSDYSGEMGVPISYIFKHSPEQFEIIGVDMDVTSDGSRFYVGNDRKYARLIIRRLSTS